jgi:hypothetical protein
MRVPLLGAVVLLLAAAVAVALVPAGIGLDRRVTNEMRRVAVEDLGRAPMILKDRNSAQIEALSMHAMTVASTEGLEVAMLQGRRDVVEQLARAAAATYGEDPVVISPEGEAIVGPSPGPEGLAELRRAGGWAQYVWYAGAPRAVGLAAIGRDGAWSGAAGSMTTVGEELAGTLAGLARSDVTVLGPDDTVVATTLDVTVALELGRATSLGEGTPETPDVDALLLGEEEYWVAQGELPGARRKA